jgi:PAS domain S-box-containing protein
MNSQPLRVLIVDDEESLLKPLAESLQNHYHYHVSTAKDGVETLRLLEDVQGHYDVALIDQVLEGNIGGLELLSQIKYKYPDIQVIIFTGWGIEKEGVNVLRQGAYRYFAKPFNLEELAMTIRFAAEESQTRQERQYMAALVQVGQGLTQTTQQDQQLMLAWEFVRSQLDVSTFFIGLYSPEFKRIHFPLVYDENQRVNLSDITLTNRRREWGLAGHVIKTNEEILWSSLEEMEQVCKAKKITPILKGKPSASGFCTPFHIGEQIRGVISAQSYQQFVFIPALQNALRALGSQLSVALENSLLFSKLERTSKQLDSLVANSLDAVIYIDKDKRITVYNKQAEEMFGYKADEMIGQTYDKLHQDIHEAKKIWDVVRHQGKILRYEITLKHKNGTKVPTFLSVASIKDSEGNEIGQARFMHNRLAEDRLHALVQASQAISSTLNLDMVLQHIMESATAAFPVAEKGSIHLFDENSELLRITASLGYSSEVANLMSLKVGEGFAGWVYQHGTSIVSENVQKDKRYKNLDHPETREQKSGICVPLMVKSKVIGTLSLDNLTIYDAFKPDDVALLSTFADQATIAIENAQLFEQVQRDLRIVSNFYTISGQLHPTQDPNQALKLIAAKVKETIGALSVSITALDTAGRPYEKAHTGYREEERVVRSHGLSTIVMDTGTPYIIPDVTKAKDIVNPGMIKSGVKAAICLPLQAEGKGKGVMWVTYNQPHNFTDAETKLLGLLANQAGGFIEAARLFQERQLLLNTSKMVSSAQDLDQSLQTLAEMMVESLAVTFCRVALLDDTGKILTVRAAYPIVSNLTWNSGIGQRYPLVDASDEALVLKTGEPQVLQPEKSLDSLKRLEQNTEFQGVLKAAVLIPLSIGNIVFGIITLGERRGWERGSFTLERVGLCKSMADQVAALIARMRLQEQAERNYASIHHLYEASGKIGSALDPEQTMHIIVEIACQSVDGWRASAVLLDETKRPCLLATTGFDREPATATSIRPDGISTGVVKTGEPITIDDVIAQEAIVNPGMVHDGVQSAICLPLRLGERNIGVLWIHYKEPHKFLPSQIEALKLYANQAATAYDNARRVQELEHMRKAAEAISGALELPQVLQRVVDSACEVLQADSSAIWSYDNVRDQFIPEELVAHGISKEKLEKFQKKAPKKGGTAHTVMERTWIGVKDILDPQYDFMGPSTLELLKSTGAKSFQGVTMKVGDEKLGILYVNYNRIRSFTLDDKKTLETFAYHAALALKKARLLKQLDIARGSAALIAEVTVAEDLDQTLQFIVKEMATVLGADAVVAYPYVPETGLFGHPPAMFGVDNEEPIRRLHEARKGTAVWKILELDKLYVAEDAITDPVVGGRFVQEEQIKSSIGIPLKVKGITVGVMFINFRSKHSFTENERTNIGLFANQAAVAIRNAQLYQAEQRRVKELTGLNQISRAIRSLTNIQQVYQQVNESVAQLAGAEMCAILLYDDRKKELVCQLPMYGVPDDIGQQYHIPVDKGDPAAIWEASDYLIINNVKQHPLVVNLGLWKLAKEVDLRDTLLVKLTSGNHNIGIIQASNKLDGTTFTEDDARLLCIFATEAAAVIENARLLTDISYRSTQLQTIAEISKSISTFLDLDGLTNQAVHVIRDRFDLYYVGLFLVDEAHEYAVLRAATGEAGQTMLKEGHKLGINHQSMVGWSITNAQARIAQDIAGEAIHFDNPHLPETRSELALPLISRDQCIGALTVQSEQKNAFSYEDTVVLQTMADQLTIAIQNARSYEELKLTKGLMSARTALAWTGMVGSTWRHAIEKHAITIREQIELLRDDLAISYRPDSIIKRLDMIERLANKILEKPITPPLSAEEVAHSIPLNELIQERVNQLMSHDQSVLFEFEFTLDDTVTIRASPEWLRRALDILIDNAIEATQDLSERRITVTTRRLECRAEISIRDNGRGIPLEIQEHLFREPIKKPQGAKGLGMGLLLAQMIVQVYGGEIRIRETGVSGSTMVIYLPLES